MTGLLCAPHVQLHVPKDAFAKRKDGKKHAMHGKQKRKTDKCWKNRRGVKQYDIHAALTRNASVERLETSTWGKTDVNVGIEKVKC